MGKTLNINSLLTYHINSPPSTASLALQNKTESDEQQTSSLFTSSEGVQEQSTLLTNPQLNCNLMVQLTSEATTNFGNHSELAASKPIVLESAERSNQLAQCVVSQTARTVRAQPHSSEAVGDPESGAEAVITQEPANPAMGTHTQGATKLKQ
jgi:hypothetical protein